MFYQFFLLTLKGLRHRPIRSWLTVLGIVIGIMLVVVILSLGAGIRGAVSQVLQMFGPDLIIIMPGKETNPFLGIAGGVKFRESDLLDLRNIRGVELVMPMSIAMLNVDFEGEKKSVLFHNQPWREMRIISEESKGLKVLEGGWPENDEDPKVMVGYRAATKMFKSRIRAGDTVIIKGARFKVAGVFSEIGLQDEDNQMYLSHKIFGRLTSRPGAASSAMIRVRDEENIDLVARQVKFQLAKQEVVRDFSVLTPDKANQLVGNILSVIESALLAIALVALIVGAVGVMNTMYTSVLERTKQIGIMKAVGASDDAVLSLFLIESGLIGFTGGVLGVVLGIGGAAVIGLVAGQMGIPGLFSFAALDFAGFLAVLVFTFVVGILAGVLPARQAAKMEPAEALRYE